MNVDAKCYLDSSGCSVCLSASAVLDIITIIMDGHCCHRWSSGSTAAPLAMRLDVAWYITVYAIIFRGMLIPSVVGTLQLAVTDCRSTEPSAAPAWRAAGGTEPNRRAIQRTLQYGAARCSVVRSATAAGDAGGRCGVLPRPTSRSAVGSTYSHQFASHSRGAAID